MTPIDPEDERIRIAAEAAAWLARLRSDDVSTEDHDHFRNWIKETPANEAAFESVSNVWELTGGVAASGLPPVRRRAIVSRRGLVLTMTALGVAGGVHALRAPKAYATEVGEQRRIALSDGSTVTLDTNTQVKVAVGGERREVQLVRGRAYFQVATDRQRPFVVSVGEQKVVALGTAFDVAQTDAQTAVLLVAGTLAVRAASASAKPQSSMLSPGDRVVIKGGQVIVRDRPNVLNATAWQTGRLVFENEPLIGAVAEMNRYSQRPLVVTDPTLAAQRVSGIFNASDAEGFAQSVSILLATPVRITPNAIILGGPESLPPFST